MFDWCVLVCMCIQMHSVSVVPWCKISCKLCLELTKLWATQKLWSLLIFWIFVADILLDKVQYISYTRVLDCCVILWWFFSEYKCDNDVLSIVLGSICLEPLIGGSLTARVLYDSVLTLTIVVIEFVGLSFWSMHVSPMRWWVSCVISRYWVLTNYFQYCHCHIHFKMNLLIFTFFIMLNPQRGKCHWLYIIIDVVSFHDAVGWLVNN